MVTIPNNMGRTTRRSIPLKKYVSCLRTCFVAQAQIVAINNDERIPRKIFTVTCMQMECTCNGPYRAPIAVRSRALLIGTFPRHNAAGVQNARSYGEAYIACFNSRRVM